MNKTGIIIGREFWERVRKKSFIITTILTPILMIGLCLAPTLMMLHDTSDVRKIVVLDETEGQFVGRSLQSDKSVEYQLLENISRKEASAKYSDEKSAFGILWIGSDILEHTDHIQLISNASSSLMLEEKISDQVSEILRTEKLRSYNIDGLDKIIAESNIRVSLSTMKNDGSGDEENMEKTSTAASMVFSMILGMLLYMFIILYGQQVLTTVIEEKQSRVLDVMVTSCSPFQMMMGKILGIAAVAAVQVLIWGLLITIASTILTPMIPVEAMDATSGLSAATAKFGNILFILKLFLCLLLYIVGGFLLYASLYAAAGSSVDSAQDAQQFSTIILLPIVMGVIVMMSVYNNPDSGLAFWCSMIPFTSPIVMMARIPFDVPDWQIILSLLILYASFILTTWLAARIYRIGIFMHGRKPSWKDLGNWLRTK
ncbi:MAG: ABC transporter permease [Bacteroidaceae bacterium]|nr:ABC transporter permease [Bacteroidaceae bacterium]